MTLALYMDEHVHRAITLGLRLRDIDVLTTQEDGRTGTSDPILLDRVTELQRVMFSQDEDFLAEAKRRQAEDFLAEAKRRQAEGLTFAGVIYAHQQRVSIGDCVRDLEIIAKVCDPEDLANRVQYLPL